jgi:hypothetical protein
MDSAELGRLSSCNNQCVQEHGKMNAMVLGNVEKHLWKLHGQRMEGW